jgi:ATP-dependent Clp protease ATP-binding subunit ClpX
MLDVMYDVPSEEGVREVVISEDVIEKGAKPLLVYEKKAKSA